MSATPKPPVLWGTVIMRWAVAALLLVALVVALVVALRPGLGRWLGGGAGFRTSGDAADIRLIAVAPDGGDELFSPAGKPLAGETLQWPGERTHVWQPGTMQRDLLLELPPDLEDIHFLSSNPGSVMIAGGRGWLQTVIPSLGPERIPAPGGGQRALLRLTLGTNSWMRSFLGFHGRQGLVEAVDVNLYFLPPERGASSLTFKGPFAVGRTNVATNHPTAAAMLLPATPGARGDARVQLSDPFYNYAGFHVLFYDAQGRRHVPRRTAAVSTGGAAGFTNQYELPGLHPTNLAFITVGEHTRTKTFHNVAVAYPGRAPRTHSATMDKLAAALGRTNVNPSSLQGASPRSTREAALILEFLPAQQNAVSYLAYSARTTNFSELTDSQRARLREMSLDMTRRAEPNWREWGLRIGLRGGWPEFTALGLTRLREGGDVDRAAAASAFTDRPQMLDAGHVPLLLALARSNPPPAVASQLVQVIARVRGVAATNALLELARADEPFLWWPAVAWLSRRHFEPLNSLSEEMQQRVVLVKNLTNAAVPAAVLAAARVRLPSFLTHEAQAESPLVFSDALRALPAWLDRDTAARALAAYLRAGGERWRKTFPSEVVQQFNAWHGKDFGGVGDGRKRGYSYPRSEEWPGIVEDVLEFNDRREREGNLRPAP